jgi:hypothetical protein
MPKIERRRGASPRQMQQALIAPRRAGIHPLAGLSLVLAAVLPLSTCAPLPPQTGGQAENAGWLGTLFAPPALNLDSLEVQVTEAFPLQVNVALRGSLPDCEQLEVAQAREGRKFILELSTSPLTGQTCQALSRAFEVLVPLQVDGLAAGVYQVSAGAFEDSFELVVDNIIRW